MFLDMQLGEMPRQKTTRKFDVDVVFPVHILPTDPRMGFKENVQDFLAPLKALKQSYFRRKKT